jgi:ankyrin repeat protein
LRCYSVGMFRVRMALGFGALLLPGAAGSAPPVQSSAYSGALTPGEDLHAAVRTGRLDDVKRLLRSGVDVDARDALGATPLLDAAWLGNSEIVRFLLQQRADPNLRHKQNGWTPLHAAVLSGHSAIIPILLSAGARPDLRYAQGETDLHGAAGRGDASTVRALLDAGVSPAATDDNGETALDEAILHNRPATVALLLERKADPNGTHSAEGRSPLHEAAIVAGADVVEKLVNAGAEPGKPDSYGMTPVELALAHHNIPAISALIRLAQENPGAEPLLEKVARRAIGASQSETFRMMVDGGFDFKGPTQAHSTYLHEAALKGQLKIVQLLLERGASVDGVDATRATPLHQAALGGNPQVVKLLIERGAQVDARDADEAATPLMMAASLDRSEAAAVLIAKGADPVLRDRLGRSALDRARQTDDSALIDLLQHAVAKAQSSHPAKGMG